MPTIETLQARPVDVQSSDSGSRVIVFDQLPINLQRSILNNLEGWGFRNPEKTARTESFGKRLEKFAGETGDPARLSFREARRAVDAHAHERNIRRNGGGGGDRTSSRPLLRQRDGTRVPRSHTGDVYIGSAVGLIRYRR